jgi:hypothetical protein
MPIDTSGLDFLCAVAPTPVIDFETRRQRADAETGELLFSVQLAALNGDAAEIVKVTTAGEPKGIAVQRPVKVSELTANYWSRGEKSGLSFRASRVEPMSATPSASSASSSSSRSGS